jgi:hypothetical protein
MRQPVKAGGRVRGQGQKIDRRRKSKIDWKDEPETQRRLDYEI